MARAARLYKKHLTIGHQRHYNILYDHATDLINRGVMGDLHYIRAQWHRGNLPGSDSWQMPLPPGAKEKDIEATRLQDEWKAWSAEVKRLKAGIVEKEALIDKISKLPEAEKTAQKIDEAKRLSREKAEFENQKEEREDDGQAYDRPAIEELIRWRLWNRTGGGLMAELGSHQLDAASIFIAAAHGGKKQYPLSVSATSSRSLFSSLDRDVDDHISAVYDYPAPGYDPNDELGSQRKITVAYSTINGNGFGGYGETVFGTKGTLLIETEKEGLLYRTSAVNDKTRVAKSGSGELDIVIDDAGDPLSSAIGYQGIYATEVSRGYCEEIEHWAYCIRKNPTADPDLVDQSYEDPTLVGADAGKKPTMPKLVTRCRGDVALWDAVIALTTNIAADLRLTVPFKKEWFDVESDDTPEFDYADQTVEKKDGESDADYQKRVADYKAFQTPNLNRAEYKL